MRKILDCLFIVFIIGGAGSLLPIVFLSRATNAGDVVYCCVWLAMIAASCVWGCMTVYRSKP